MTKITTLYSRKANLRLSTPSDILVRLWSIQRCLSQKMLFNLSIKSTATVTCTLCRSCHYKTNSCRVFNIQNHRKDFHNSEVKNIYIVTCYINVYIVSHISYKAKGSLVQFLSKLPLTS